MKDDDVDDRYNVIDIDGHEGADVAKNVKQAMDEHRLNKLIVASIVISMEIGDKESDRTVDMDEVVMIADWIHHDDVTDEHFVEFAASVSG